MAPGSGGSDEDFDWIRIWRRYMPQVIQYGLKGYYVDTERRRRTAKDAEHAAASMYVVGCISALESQYKKFWWHGVRETDQLGRIAKFEEADYAVAIKLRNALVHHDGDLTKIDNPPDSAGMVRLDSWGGVSVDSNGVARLELPAVDLFSKMFLAMTNEKDAWY